MKHCILIVLLLFIQLLARGQQFVPLWPENNKPGSNGTSITDTMYNERIWRVGTPGLYCFPATNADNKGAAVMICPGGGYERISHISNGFNLAKWFNTIGINAFVLIYRLPHQKDLSDRQQAPVMDAQRGMKWIRANAHQWRIDTSRVGMMGTSAGGHLAAITTTALNDVSEIGDSLHAFNWRPSFLILLSPVISLDQYAHAGSRKNFLGSNPDKELSRMYSAQNRVRTGLPPTFMVHAQNDSTVNVRNSVLFHTALIEKNIAASLHIFPQGGHGIRIDDNPGSTDLWLELLELWLKEMKFITPIPFK